MQRFELQNLSQQKQTRGFEIFRYFGQELSGRILMLKCWKMKNMRFLQADLPENSFGLTYRLNNNDYFYYKVYGLTNFTQSSGMSIMDLIDFSSYDKWFQRQICFICGLSISLYVNEYQKGKRHIIDIGKPFLLVSNPSFTSASMSSCPFCSQLPPIL